MKRYRVAGIQIDSRPSLLAREIDEENIRRSILSQYGELYFEEKVRNFVDFGNLPFSIIAYHNRFFTQSRDAFVMGSYYPALTGICALGERILNHLLLGLRDSFKSTHEYKKVYQKESYDDWNLLIKTLETWNILLPEVADNYEKLRKIRIASIHFKKEIDVEDRKLALEAGKLLSEIILGQFPGIGGQPWFIKEAKGAAFIKKEYENDPFVKLVYLPNSVYVGTKHWYGDMTENGWLLHDDFNYEDKEITDQEFIDLFEKATKERLDTLFNTRTI